MTLVVVSPAVDVIEAIVDIVVVILTVGVVLVVSAVVAADVADAVSIVLGVACAVDNVVVLGLTDDHVVPALGKDVVE
mgnify:CR=1 FL=1